MSMLDETIRKETKVLQLSGNIKLESILELISEKLEGNILGLNIPAFRGAAQACQSNDNGGDRLTRLETMMANVMNKLDNLQKTKADPPRERQQICKHCQKPGHDKSRCFKLKKCFKCNQMGHKAKFCKEKQRNQTAASQIENSSGSEVSHQIVPERRTAFKLQQSEAEFMFAGDEFMEVNDVKIPPLCNWTNVGKTLKIPITNHSGNSIKVRKGQNIWALQEIEAVTASLTTGATGSSLKLDESKLETHQ
eukprot:gene15821-7131_t